MPVRIGEITVVARTNDLLGEIPIWHGGAETLYWVDLFKPAIHGFAPRSGEVFTWTLPERIGAYSLREADGFILSGKGGLSLWQADTGMMQRLASPEFDRPGNIYNDGRCDASGRFIFGSMDKTASRPTGRLWSIDEHRNINLLQDHDIQLPNGLCWSPNGKTMYFGDSRSAAIYAYDYDQESGKIANRRLFADTRDIPGLLDGIAVDAHGYLWNARMGGSMIARFAPNGMLDQSIKVPPSQPTHVAFGDADLKTLYVTTAQFGLAPDLAKTDSFAGALLAVRVDVAGIAESFFAG